MMRLVGERALLSCPGAQLPGASYLPARAVERGKSIVLSQAWLTDLSANRHTLQPIRIQELFGKDLFSKDLHRRAFALKQAYA
jgi:hypothetical protein